jgi:hypothetical protein
MIFTAQDLFLQTEVCIDTDEEVEVAIAGLEALHLVISVEAIHVIECTIVTIEKECPIEVDLVVEAIAEGVIEEEISEIETGKEIMIRGEVAEVVRDQSVHHVTVEVGVGIEAKVEVVHLEETETEIGWAKETEI